LETALQYVQRSRSDSAVELSEEIEEALKPLKRND
jgi:hypothetical protein